MFAFSGWDGTIYVNEEVKHRRVNPGRAASLLIGFILVVLSWVYLLASSVQTAFRYILDLTGILFAFFYVLTAFATIVYYRRRILSGAVEAITLGVLPLASAAFLVWMAVKAIMEKDAQEQWTLVGIVAFGIALMLVARFVLKSPFFSIQRESDPGPGKGDSGSRELTLTTSEAADGAQRPPPFRGVTARSREGRKPRGSAYPRNMCIPG